MKQKLLIFFLFTLFSLQTAFAQNRKITGVVTGADDGQPLPGVSVMVQGTKLGTLTSGDGQYTLNVPSGGGVLVFTFIGYATQNVTITSSNTYNVKIASSTRQLTEVTVTDGYAVQSKKSYTGSATTVGGREVENKPFSTPLQALQGEVAGLNISTNSGQPGANVQVNLRGPGSIGADSNPLYVIDGMIINAGDLSRLGTAGATNVLAGINNNDIESVTVLKDASATAIYGSRGSNGVIVITTKKGKSGKTQVNFDAESGVTNNLKVSDAGKALTADQYRTLFLEGENNASANYLAIPTNDPAKNPYSPARIASDIANYGLNSGQSNDWYNLVTKRGTQQQYNVSLNGGGESTRVFASTGYFKQEATTLASSLKRITGQLNLDQTISKRFSFNTGINFSNVNQYSPLSGGAFGNPFGSAYFLTPFSLAYNPDGSLNTDRLSGTGFTSNFNPLYIAKNDKKYDSQTRLLTNASVRWNIWDELKYTAFGSIDYNVLEEQQYNNPVMGDGRTAGGRGFDYYTRNFNWLFRNQLDYRYNVKGVEDFYVDATVGYEAQKNQAYFITAQSNGFPATQPLLTASANAATVIAGNAYFSNYTFDSFYSRANINFKNRYSLSGSFRRDGSSRFGANNQFGNFYSVGGAWNIDQESFFKAQKILTTLKLRGSYGTTGNANLNANNTLINNYGSRATVGYGTNATNYTGSGGANYAGSTGQNYNTVGNANLTWESSKKFDLGLNLGFFNDRLSFDFDYYRNTISGLIQSVPIAIETGFSTIRANAGSMLNRGLETSIHGIPVRIKDFTWSTNINIAFNKNTVTALVNGAAYINPNNIQFQIKEGLDFYTFYSRQYAGVDPANGNALWYTDATRSATTSVYNSAQRVNAGQADPKIFGGFNNTFDYKGITLSADFYYNFGNKIYDSWSYYLNDDTYQPSNKYQYIYQNRWTTPGQITDVPRMVAGGTNSGQSSSYSSRFLYYGDYIRLKNLTLGYNFKNISYLKKIGISRLYLYGRGTNIWTKTYDKRLPFDPEVGITGVSNLAIPQVKTFTIGLNVSL